MLAYIFKVYEDINCEKINRAPFLPCCSFFTLPNRSHIPCKHLFLRLLTLQINIFSVGGFWGTWKFPSFSPGFPLADLLLVSPCLDLKFNIHYSSKTGSLLSTRSWLLKFLFSVHVITLFLERCPQRNPTLC